MNREGNFDLDSYCLCFHLLHLFTFPLMGMDKHKVIIYILGFHFKVKRGLEMSVTCSLSGFNLLFSRDRIFSHNMKSQSAIKTSNWRNGKSSPVKISGTRGVIREFPFS